MDRDRRTNGVELRTIVVRRKQRQEEKSALIIDLISGSGARQTRMTSTEQLSKDCGMATGNGQLDGAVVDRLVCMFRWRYYKED